MSGNSWCIGGHRSPCMHYLSRVRATAPIQADDRAVELLADEPERLPGAMTGQASATAAAAAAAARAATASAGTPAKVRCWAWVRGWCYQVARYIGILAQAAESTDVTTSAG